MLFFVKQIAKISFSNFYSQNELFFCLSLEWTLFDAINGEKKIILFAVSNNEQKEDNIIIFEKTKKITNRLSVVINNEQALL